MVVVDIVYNSYTDIKSISSFQSTFILLRKSDLDADVYATTGSHSHKYTPRNENYYTSMISGCHNLEFHTIIITKFHIWSISS